jgi:lysophospholipase L1-like esterase
MANRSRRLFAIFLAVWTAILSFAMAELLVRFALGDMDYAMEMWKYAHVLKRVSNDPEQVFTHSPGARAHLMGVEVRINRHGLRGREIDYAKPPDTRRVLMLGDSLTFGWGVAEAEVTSLVVERSLNDKRPDPRWAVINSGVGNYNTRLEVHYLVKEGLRYAPDVVVLNYFINDAETDPRYAGNFVNMHSAAWVFFTNRLDVVSRRLTRRGSWHDYYRGLYREDAAGWRGARKAILRFGEVCRQHELSCLIVHQPELHQLDPYPFVDAERAVAAAADEARIPYLDLLPALRGLDPKTLWVSVEDTHPNGRCDAIYGAAIADRIEALVGKTARARRVR